MLRNQWLALTILRATGPWLLKHLHVGRTVQYMQCSTFQAVTGKIYHPLLSPKMAWNC